MTSTQSGPEEKLDLGQGYAIEAKQVDVDGKKVWLAFSKDENSLTMKSLKSEPVNLLRHLES